MTCDEYLARLSTASLDEIEDANDFGHPANCPECGRVSRLVAERERDRIDAFDGLYANAPVHTERGALPQLARSRGGMSWFTMVCAAALATLALLVVMRLTVGGRTAEPAVGTLNRLAYIEESFRIRCLTGPQAAELVRPGLRLPKNLVVYAPARDPGVLTVLATPEQLRWVQATLDMHESAASTACPAI